MTMPGFTAEASVYKTDRFTRTTNTAPNNTTQSVQPALRGNCFALGMLWEAAVTRDDEAWATFYLHVALGAGCK
jgi:hypothetical protein